MDIKCIKFQDYKCFKSGCTDNIKPINVIIGKNRKNNIGKSSILDIFEMLYSKREFKNTKIILEKKLTEEDILKVFGKSTYGGGIPNQSVEGNIVVDSISTLDMTLTYSNYEGTINKDNTAKNIKLVLNESSKIKLTGDSYVTSLEDEDASYSNIDFNGYKLYVNGVAIN